MHQAVLHELHASHLARISLYIFFLHLHLKSLHQLVFGKVPLQFFKHSGEVLVQFLLGHLLVRREHPTLEECLGELQALHLLHNGSFGIQSELVFRILCHVRLYLGFHASAEVCLVLHVVLAIHFCKQLAVDSRRLVARNGLNLKGKVRSQVFRFLLADTRQRRHLYLAAVSCSRVEGNYIAFLRTLEECFLRIVLHVSGHQHSTFLHNPAFFLLREQTFQHVAVLHCLYIYVLAEALCIGVHLLVHHLVGNGNHILRQFVVPVQFCIELGSHSNVEGEGKSVLVIQVHVGSQLVVWQRVPQHFQVVVINVLAQLLADHFVQHVCQHALAVHLLHQSHRHHTRTESRYIRLLANLLQVFLNFLLIICRLHGQRQHSLQVFHFTLVNLHIV